MPIPLSVLDLAPVIEGGSVKQALHNSRDLALHAEQLGYQRFWMAEHHNMPGIASSATSVALGFVAEGTSTIRLGAGGIMLPNHAPLVIAEQFGTLASLYPGRIELGLGRAPGTDQLTAQALRRNLNADIDQFPQDVVELLHYFAAPEPGQKIQAVPGAGTRVPIWILGSSLFGAQLAAQLGLPYAFASHFAPAALHQAIEVYRTYFEPSEYLEKPYMMLGYNVCAADSEEEAHFQRSSSLQALVALRKGTPGRMPPPVRDFEATLTAQEKLLLEEFGRCSAIGTAGTVTTKMREFVAETGADELMVTGQLYDQSARLKSFGIAAEAAANVNI